MRTMLIIFALLAAGTASIAGSATPISYDYPWCVFGELRLGNLDRVAPPLRRAEDRVRFIESLRKAGLPE